MLKKTIFRFLIDSHINDRLSIRTSKDRFILFFLIKSIFYISLSELLPPTASLNSRGRARSKNNSRTIMASGSDSDVSRSLKTPETLKAPIWRNFGFREIEGTNELDKSKAVCKKCGIEVKHCGNTTNLKNHLRRHHPNLSLGPQQTKLDMLSLLPINSGNTSFNMLLLYTVMK